MESGDTAVLHKAIDMLFFHIFILTFSKGLQIPKGKKASHRLRPCFHAKYLTAYSADFWQSICKQTFFQKYQLRSLVLTYHELDLDLKDRNLTLTSKTWTWPWPTSHELDLRQQVKALNQTGHCTGQGVEHLSATFQDRVRGLTRTNRLQVGNINP